MPIDGFQEEQPFQINNPIDTLREYQVSINIVNLKLNHCISSFFKDTFLEPQCMFYFKRHPRNAYATFRSAINETWYLGFKKNGDTRHGQRTGLNHTAAWLMIEFQLG